MNDWNISKAKKNAQRTCSWTKQYKQPQIFTFVIKLCSNQSKISMQKYQLSLIDVCTKQLRPNLILKKKLISLATTRLRHSVNRPRYRYLKDETNNAEDLESPVQQGSQILLSPATEFQTKNVLSEPK